MSGQNTALLAVIGLFILYLVWRFLQVRSGRRMVGGPRSEAMREKVKKARAETDPAQRAQRFVEAGDIARDAAQDPSLAIGYYLRALRADAGSRFAIDALRGMLTHPGAARQLERIYWRLLSRIPPEGATRAAWLEVWSALADLYARGYRSPARARAIRTLLDQLGSR